MRFRSNPDFQRGVLSTSCPRNHEDPTKTAIRLDGGFLLPGYHQFKDRREVFNKLRDLKLAIAIMTLRLAPDDEAIFV